MLKEFFFARANIPGNNERRRGQLVMARRTNWVAALSPLLVEGGVPLMVTDHYQYAGLGGKVSKKTTSLSLPSGGQSFTSEYTYGPLGDIATIDFPSGDWPHESAPQRTVTYNRRLGFLTAVPGYASAINYQLGGMLEEIQYPSGARWRQTAEAATGWERPDKIETFSGSTLLWSTGDYQYLHADHLGSTRLVTSATGTQVSRHDFLPFGEESTAVTGNDAALKFTGHERDQPGKPHDYMHARFYSPQLGRFLSPDPIGGWQSSPQSWNLFSYVTGNPLKYVDPAGLSMTCVPASGGEVCTVTESGEPLPKLNDLVDRPVSFDNMTREDFAREVARDQWNKLSWIPEGSDKVARCTAQELGLSTVAGAAVVAAGQPWMAKRFVTPGSSKGTSLASSSLSRALPQKLPVNVWAPTTVRPFGTARVAGRVLGRWVPFAGWGILANDIVGIADCVGS